jgi:hypothetical protein
MIFIAPFFIQRKVILCLQTQDPPLLEGLMSPVVIAEISFSQPAVVLRGILFLDDHDGIVPAPVPFLIEKNQEFIQRNLLLILEVLVEFFQSLVRQGSQEGLGGILSFDLDTIDVIEFVLELAGFEGAEA